MFDSETDSLQNKVPKQEVSFVTNKVIPISENSAQESKDSYAPNPIEIIWENIKVEV